MYREQRACKGCGTQFEAHTKSRDYCSTICRIMRGAAAGQMGTCLACQSSYWDGQQASGRTREEFVIDHEACRRTILDREGRPDNCLCRECKARKGVTAVLSVPPSARKRRKGRTYGKYRQLVFERDNYVCQVCQLPTDPEARPTDERYPTLDHIFSIALGGDDELDNLRTAHRWCNITLNSEGGLVYDEWVREEARRRFNSLEPTVEP